MKTQRTKIKNLKADPIGEQLSKSDEMRPYVDYYVAQAKGLDTTLALKTIQSLPADKRYLVRVSNYLDLALSDLDTETARLDVKTLSAVELLKIVNGCRLRLLQLVRLVDFLGKNLADFPSKGEA
jgi:hypothetical protein